MKNFFCNRLLLSVLFLLGCFLYSNVNASKKDKETVLFYVHMDCQGCVDKIMNNIAYEKGVNDIKCDLKSKTVEVTYFPTKTDVSTLQEAFKKINKPAFVSLEEYKLYYKQE